MRTLRILPWFGPALLALVGASPDARAADDTALASELFESGVKKMEQGRCDEAPVSDPALCSEARDAFQRAFALYPAGLGALRNLAYVEKALGLVGSAARHFRELARRAPLDPNPARRLWADFAREEIEALAPRIPRLTIVVPPDVKEGVTVTLDDEPLPKPVWGTAIEVDPGDHAVRVEATGRTSFTATVTLAEAETARVDAVLAPIATPPEPPKPKPTPSAPERSSPRAWSRAAPLVVAGAGGVAVIVGLGLGWAAIKKRDEVCDARYCEPEGYAQGRSLARASTIVTGVGLATAASGLAWWWLTKQSSARPGEGTTLTPYASAHGGGLAFACSF